MTWPKGCEVRATSSGEFLVIGKRCALADGGEERARALGYRPAWSGADGTEVWALDGHALDLASSERPGTGPNEGHALVVGVTVEGDPAQRLLGWTPSLDVSSAGYPVDLLSGNYAGVRLADGEVWVVGDHLGSIAVYIAATASGAHVVGTHLHHVATVAERRTIDQVSTVQFLMQGKVTFPHTLFRGIERLEPATAARVTRNQLRQRRPWWQPSQAERGAEPEVREVASAVAPVFEHNIAQVLARHDEARVLLSAGRDSRAVIKAAAGQVPQLRADIILDRKNREYRIAQVVASALGARLCYHERTSDHYTADPGVDAIDLCGCYDLGQMHARGIEPGGATMSLDGWPADSLWRGHRLRSRRRKVRGVSVGPPVPSPRPINDRTIRFPMWAPEAKKETLSRYRRHLDRVGRFRRDSDVQAWAWMWPLSDLETYGFFMSNRRMMAHCSPFAFGNLMVLAAPLSEVAKLDGELHRRAFLRSLGSIGLLPTPQFNVPRASPRFNAAIDSVQSASHRLPIFSPKKPLLNGSWQSPWVGRRAATESLAALPRSTREALTRHLADDLSALKRPEVNEMSPAIMIRYLQLVAMLERDEIQI